MDNKKQDLSKDTVKAAELGFEAAASTIIVRTNADGEEEFFIAIRNQEKEAGYGDYAFLGCSITPGETFEDELAKMLYEQTGLVVDMYDTSKVQFNNWFESISSATKHYVHHAYVVRLDGEDIQLKNDSKYTNGIWVKKSDMPKYFEKSFINLIAHYTNYVNGARYDSKVNYDYREYNELYDMIARVCGKKFNYCDQNLEVGAPRVDKKGFTIAVNAIIVKEDGVEEEYCFDFRIAQNKAGYLMHALYGGTATFGQKLQLELVRELKEELNIDVDVDDVEFDNFFQCAPNEKRHFLHYAFRVNKWTGEMKNLETEKSGGPHWFKKSEIPSLKDKFFITWGHLDNMEKGVAHSSDNTINYKAMQSEADSTKK